MNWMSRKSCVVVDEEDGDEGLPLVGKGGIFSLDEEVSPLMELLMEMGNEREVTSNGGIKLGLGDFIFYGVLVGRAAMYHLMTVYACYIAVISGLGCTLILLSAHRRPLPVLPISIALGVVFYFLTRFF